MMYFSFWNYTYLWGLEHIYLSLQEVSVALAVLIVSRAGECGMGLTLETPGEAMQKNNELGQPLGI